MKIEDYKLCYISDGFAYFTTQALSEQWGDDWNDAPYECNAGLPYTYSDFDKAKGKEEWSIVKVAYDQILATPDYKQWNSSYSVESINKGTLPWLRPYPYENRNVVIYAGTTLLDFIAKIKQAGGEVYATEELWHKLAYMEH